MAWAEIKKAINSDLAKPLNTLITEVKDALTTTLNDKASQTSVTAIQTTANSISSRVNSIPTSAIKSVQRGYFEGSSTKTPAGVLINHNAVDLNKSLLFVSGFKANYTGSGLITASRSSTNFLMEGSNFSTYAFIFSWELIEFY